MSFVDNENVFRTVRETRTCPSWRNNATCGGRRPTDYPPLQKRFDEAGLVLLRGVKSQLHLLDIAGVLGTVFRHPHAAPDGLTHVKAAHQWDSADAEARNEVGLTSSALTPHTDRSGMDRPPNVLGFWIEHQSAIGGSSTFVNGAKLIEELSVEDPQAVRALTRPKSVAFKSEAGLSEGQIVSFTDKGLLLRFRYDKMVYMAPDVAGVLPLLNRLMTRLAERFSLNDGEGYIVNNHSWLHGRTHFHGCRSAYRVLACRG
ncbi:MAG TPA: TauD/TfdA family dioxygenase [Burkholderiaceae bacterium]|nr:TauD/TfdA family dioxygenase [Burkholderiaceae bacterium]